ncbi:MAG: glycosyltransferase [Candidatus Helarchaeota archaeon]|nr:glycosyltransferase [Candidatus Helarchaeota archaeon]
MCKVSVIIPTYNRFSFLVEAVKSVLSQTFANFELIIVDDGSTDETRRIQEIYRERVKYLFQEKRGVSSARNKGIINSSGEYICFLDSDDLWKKNKLEIQVNFMDNNRDFLVCYTGEIWIRNGVRVNQMKKHKKYSGMIYDKCLPLCIISPSSVMMRREIFDKIGFFDENLPICEDYDMWLRISKDYPIFFIDKKLIIKRGGHQDQLSRQYWGNDRFRIKALTKMLDNGNLNPEQKMLTIMELQKKCDILSKGFLKRGKLKEFNQYKQLQISYSSL